MTKMLRKFIAVVVLVRKHVYGFVDALFTFNVKPGFSYILGKTYEVGWDFVFLMEHQSFSQKICSNILV